ncbi:hypothetical protein BCY91_07515 [Pelobium manganitolerans]|uniref:Histidine kinase/HSP90-like ATPase domain-containing protein n=1 Tax=Pelobium manganitolerans TaxID=1842495 RepID=A0A419S3W3_9SPHI|nr:ATP-binding protein [Pelobium manganitolerans]RKD14326.1 hypothetical protein BCY91_07515 [Pelobium manganitolerans]
MASNAKKLTLEIPVHISSYKMFIETCCNFVSGFEPLATDFKRLSKFKLVIMELLTNAMKHSRAVSFIELEIGSREIIIKKIDSGNLFTFTDDATGILHGFPLTAIAPSTRLCALLGNNYKLDVLVKNENVIEFLEPAAVDYDDVQLMPENFGLMVIRQCASSFHYYFNSHEGKNAFEVIFKF